MLFCSHGDFAGVYRHHNHSPVTQSFSEAIQPILNSVKFYSVGITWEYTEGASLLLTAGDILQERHLFLNDRNSLLMT